MSKKLVIIMTTFNNEAIIERTVMSCLTQNYSDLELVIVDDGSKDKTVEILNNISTNFKNLHIITTNHLERGICRNKAIDMAKDLKAEYLMILDSDMVLKDNLLLESIEYMNKEKAGALVIPEIAFSDHNNFISKVKVFERLIINNAGKNIGINSIEAARLWSLEEFLKTGGLNPNQISFEETQPTIRYLEMGGIIKRAYFSGVLHDEKYVTLKNLISKKTYYFSVMNKTLESEKGGIRKALQRWYFFRPVLYRPSNIVRYIKHPILTAGMIYIYIILSFVGVKEILKSKFVEKKDKIAY